MIIEMIKSDPVEKKELSDKKYRASEQGKAAQKRYLSSEKGRKARKAYSQSEKGRAAQLRYRQSQQGKRAQKKNLDLRKFFTEVAAWLQEHPGRTIADYPKEKSGKDNSKTSKSLH